MLINIFDGEHLLVAEDGENLRTRKLPIAFLASGQFWVNNHAHILRGNHRAETRFLLYALLQADISGYLTGSTMPKLTQGNLHRIPILAPALSEQRAIARILGVLDDKIELNRQMNATLEALARTLFQSWFVDFDPVRAKAAGRAPHGMDAATAALFPDGFEDSALGEAPQGWRVGKFGDIAKNSRRGANPEDIPPDIAYIGLEHMPRKSIALDEWGYASDMTSNKSWFEQGDILFGKLRPYFHKVGVAVIQGVCSTDILVVNPKAPDWFAFALMHASSDAFVSHTTASSDGTKMPRTNWQDMARYDVALPSANIVRVFNLKVLPMVEAIRANILQSRTLTATRDMLLPKLLSGEIRVGEAERIAEEAV